MSYEDKVLDWDCIIHGLIRDMTKESVGGDPGIEIDFQYFLCAYSDLIEEIGKTKRKK